MSLEQARHAEAAKLSPAGVIKAQLERFGPVLDRLLVGTGINRETFTAQIGNACRATPKLLQCHPDTLVGAALKCAQLGLAPNDVRNLAWIIPYGKEATFQIGYGGIMELARRAVPGLRFDGRAVYQGDEFDVDYGRPHPLVHRPAVVLGRDAGESYAWYVRATYPDGGEQVQVLDRKGVEYHRKFSKQPNGGMWKDSYDAAALKSVVLDMKRFLPSSAQLVAALEADEQTLTPDDVEVVDVGEIEHDEGEAAA